MKQLGLIFAIGLLLVACWTTAVSSRSLDVVSESDASNTEELSPLNVPAILDFEGGEGDESNGIRDKRTPRFLFRTVSCLFTFLVNPGCLQGIMGGAGSSSSSSSSSSGSLSSYGSNRREQSSQPFYMISLPRYNDTDSNGTATEYPIYPIESTSEYIEDPPPRPMNPIMQLIQFKMRLIPNFLRRFIPGLGGGRRDDGGSGGGLLSLLGNLGGGGGGAGGGGLFANLGFGQGRLAGLFGRNNAGGGGGLFPGFGGLGFGGGGLGGGLGGGQY